MNTDKHEFYLTGIYRMNRIKMITKHPAYPVNPVKNEKTSLLYEVVRVY